MFHWSGPKYEFYDFMVNIYLIRMSFDGNDILKHAFSRALYSIVTTVLIIIS